MTQAKPTAFAATRAFTIARVSSDEQEEYSPAAQSSRMKIYCQQQNLNILESFEITESSTRGDRKRFLEIITKAEEIAKKIQEPIAIVTDKVDRLQRGFKQQPILDKLRKDGLLEYHFSSDSCVIHKKSPANELFMWNVSVALAQNFTDSLSDNVNRAKEQKLARGEWVARAPVGYLNWRDESIKRHGRGKAEIRLDSVRAPLVRQLFEKYATGCYSLSQLAKLGREIGLTNNYGGHKVLSKSQVHRIIMNPFYYGVMRLKTTGEEYPHAYPTIISKSLFYQCQDIRTGRRKPHARYGKKAFLFRGLITCAHTGKLSTAQAHRKTYKNGTTAAFTYLVSYDKDASKKVFYTREEAVLEQVEVALDKLTIKDDDELKDILSYVSMGYKAKRTEARSHMAEFRREYSELEYKIDRLTDLRLGNELTAEEFKNQKHKFRDRQYELKALLEAYDETDDSFLNKLNCLISLAANAVETFRSSSFDQKRELLQYVFQNLQLDEKNLVYSMASPFKEIADCNKNGEWCTLINVVRTCEDTRSSIVSMPFPYWKPLKAA